jgi:hypothetical protein
MELSEYGKRRLGSLYTQNKDNTEFESLDDFISYALSNGYKDIYEIIIDVKSQGLRSGNISFSRSTKHVRSDRLGLFSSSSLTYGEKVNLIKNFSGELHDMNMKYTELLYSLDVLERSNTSSEHIEVVRSYLRNAIDNSIRILDEIDKISLK